MLEIIVDENNNLTIAELLQERNITVSLPCGGTGRCLGCRVKVESEDKSLQGMLLACKTVPKFPFRVWPITEEKLMIPEQHFFKDNSDDFSLKTNYRIAIDLGTTTYTIALSDHKGKLLETLSGVNPQRRYGADVISRIQACIEGRADLLQEILLQALLKDIDIMLRNANASEDDVIEVVIAGNTTMEHILAGVSVAALGKAPFQPETKATIHGHLGPYKAIYFPVLSGFVGGDLVAGMTHLKLSSNQELQLLIDLGTNGEMLLGNADGFYFTSASAGPAFEGGEISCGVASIPGAISGVELLGSFVKVTTIQNEKPIGLCGSGLVDLIYELRRKEIIDENGTFISNDSEGFLVTTGEFGEIRLLQEDIHNFLLAKAAIATGIEILLKEANYRMQDISKVYIAGGFGQTIHVKKAVGIALLPESLLDKIEVVGNTSLKGAMDYSVEIEDEVEMLRSKIQEVSLANHPDFEELFLKHMKL